MGRTLLDGGDFGRAWTVLQEGLAVADRMLKRAPSSLSHQLDRAEALEAMGAYCFALATKPDVRVHRAKWKSEARVHFEKSLAIWQDWTQRSLAAPYSGTRQRQAAALLAAVDKL
jgi:hypothetical protein